MWWSYVVVEGRRITNRKVGSGMKLVEVPVAGSALYGLPRVKRGRHTE